MIKKLSFFLLVVVLTQVIPIGWPVLMLIIILTYFCYSKVKI
jgi:hypothetical protein